MFHLYRPKALAAATLVLGFGAFGTVAASATITPAKYAHGHTWSRPRHALFVETGAVSGNTILAYSRGQDGSVSLSNSYATGGNGGVAAGATADPLASQDGLVLINNGANLLAVNAGSNTVSLFDVRGTFLSLVQVIPSGGDFPVSIASQGDTVAVLNSGGAGSVAEFLLRGDRLIALPGEVRSLGLANTNPPDYLHGAGQVGFTPNGADLVVTTKASTSSYEVFSVGPFGRLAATPVITPSATAVPFSFSFDAAGQLVGAEAGTSTVSTYTVLPSGALSLIGSVSDGATALCWITTANGYYYGSNAGSGTLSSFTLGASGSPALDAATAAVTHAGTTDAAVSPDGNYLYVESGGSGAFDAFAIHSNGTLAPIETVWNIPVGSEGVAVS
jgi:hypothetical protein